MVSLAGVEAAVACKPGVPLFFIYFIWLSLSYL